MTATSTAAEVEIYSAGARTEDGSSPTWLGVVPDSDPEAIFRYFNRVDAEDAARLRDAGYLLPSLSVGDVISYTATGRSLIVCPAGFAEIDHTTLRTIANSTDPFLSARLYAMEATPSC